MVREESIRRANYAVREKEKWRERESGRLRQHQNGVRQKRQSQPIGGSDALQRYLIKKNNRTERSSKKIFYPRRDPSTP